MQLAKKYAYVEMYRLSTLPVLYTWQRNKNKTKTGQPDVLYRELLQ